LDSNNPHLLVADDFAEVNKLILAQLHSDIDLVETISQYLVESGGKRVRPLLVLLTAKCLGYQGQSHQLLATIIEFLHTATLLHDDVVDHSSQRRGKATANSVWGNAPSVLVGDFLYSRAFQLMIRLDDMRILSILADSTNQISEGEVHQLVNIRNLALTEAEYMQVIEAKTAVLFQASSHTAAVLSGAAVEAETSLKQFGLELGMTFQLIDDWLDYAGNAEALGKNLGDDLAEGKLTLPLIHTRNNANEKEREYIDQCIENFDNAQLPKLTDLIRQYGGLDYTRQRASEAADRAHGHLQGLPANPYRQAMADLVELALNRSH